MYYIGLDLGGTGIKVGIVTEDGNIIAKDSVPTRAQDGYEVISKDMADLVLKVLSDNGITLDEIKCIGIGCPGSIDDKNGVVYYANNILLRNAPICAEMKKYIDKPVYIGNDANCAALGEYFALNDDSVTDFVAITLGTGVGGGVIINKKLFTGYNGVGAELGHTVIAFDGEQCSCGRKGCWEAYASATALIREAEKAANENPDSLLKQNIDKNGGKANGKLVFDSADAGDKTAEEVVDKYIKSIGEGIINIINIFQPNVLAIGGGISNQGEKLLKPIKDYVMPRTYASGIVPPVELTIAKLGNDAGIIGAAFLGR